MWKYSDDEGKTWSPKHYTIPVPRNYIETVNSFSEAHGGKGNETATQIMWQVSTMVHGIGSVVPPTGKVQGSGKANQRFLFNI